VGQGRKEHAYSSSDLNPSTSPPALIFQAQFDSNVVRRRQSPHNLNSAIAISHEPLHVPFDVPTHCQASSIQVDTRQRQRPLITDTRPGLLGSVGLSLWTQVACLAFGLLLGSRGLDVNLGNCGFSGDLVHGGTGDRACAGIMYIGSALGAPESVL
jgi:hypothetical protein